MEQKSSQASQQGLQKTFNHSAVIAGILALVVFGIAAFINTSTGQELLGLRIESMSSEAALQTNTTVDCIQAPCETSEVPPVINCVVAPCPGDPVPEEKLVISTSSLPSGNPTEAYKATVSAKGGTAPYIWSLSMFTARFAPQIFSIESSTGIITGKPETGTYEVTVMVTDAKSQTVNQSYKIEIRSEPEVAHKTGTLILGVGHPTGVSLIIEEKGMPALKPFGSAEIFLSHGYRWDRIVAANSADKNIPFASSGFTLAPGTVVRDGQSPRTIYVVYPNNVIRGFASAEVFMAMGYTYSMSYYANLSLHTVGAPITQIEKHAPGTDVIDPGTRTVYRINDDNLTRSAYPSLSVFNTWHTYNNDFSRVVKMNDFDYRLDAGLRVIAPRY